MKYKFPHITNISQVLPVIKDKTEFVVAEKEGGYTVVNYLVATAETFPPVTEEAHAILRELRGIIFDTATGNILRRPLHKFWNVNEKEETQLQELDFSLPHKVYTKMDGSMIVPFMVEGRVRFGTKMGLTDVAKPVEAFVAKNPKYLQFSTWCIENQISPIFEWTSRQQKIVIDYPTDMLTLLTARHTITGEYLQL